MTSAEPMALSLVLCTSTRLHPLELVLRLHMSCQRVLMWFFQIPLNCLRSRRCFLASTNVWTLEPRIEKVNTELVPESNFTTVIREAVRFILHRGRKNHGFWPRIEKVNHLGFVNILVGGSAFLLMFSGFGEPTKVL